MLPTYSFSSEISSLRHEIALLRQEVSRQERLISRLESSHSNGEWNRAVERFKSSLTVHFSCILAVTFGLFYAAMKLS